MTAEWITQNWESWDPTRKSQSIIYPVLKAKQFDPIRHSTHTKPRIVQKNEGLGFQTGKICVCQVGLGCMQSHCCSLGYGSCVNATICTQSVTCVPACVCICINVCICVCACASVLVLVHFFQVNGSRQKLLETDHLLLVPSLLHQLIITLLYFLVVVPLMEGVTMFIFLILPRHQL